MQPTTATRNGMPICRTCWGEGKHPTPGFMDDSTCEDCLGTGIDSDIPLQVALDDVPDHVEAFSAAPVIYDAIEDALSLLRNSSQRLLPKAIADNVMFNERLTRRTA